MYLYVLALAVSERRVPRKSENINSKQICVFVLHVQFDIMSEVGGNDRALRRPCFGRKRSMPLSNS